MKKGIILILTIITLIITFIFAEIFSLYHFGDMPTLLTTLYLISLFSVFEYILLSLFYIIKKIISKEKISGKEIIGIVLLFIALILILFFIIVIDIDRLNWYAYSTPFYINVIIKGIKYILPVIVLIIVSIFLLKNNNK